MSRRFRCILLLFLFLCAFTSIQAQTTGHTGSTAASTKPAVPAIEQTATDEYLQTDTLDNNDDSGAQQQSKSDNPTDAGEQSCTTAQDTSKKIPEKSDKTGVVSASDEPPRMEDSVPKGTGESAAGEQNGKGVSENTDANAESATESELDENLADTAMQKNGVGGQDPSVKNSLERARISHQFEGGVTAIADSSITHSFFAAGKDGFITRFSYRTMKPETWQVSTMPIKRIAVHPKKTFVAVYETDGFSIHTISLWDWQTKKQLYAKRFTSSVLSLSWSAQGTYLFIGTASTEGITILDASGKIKKVYPRPPGIVLLAATGPSEKSIVTYGETGRLVYADIAKKSILTQYETEDRLENPELIKNYTQIIGYKSGNVVVVKAASGEVLENYPARSALFAGKITDSLPVWIEKGDARRTWHLCQGDKKSPAFTLPHPAVITAARHVDATVVIGTDDGRLYRLKQNSDATISLTELNIDTSIQVSDICTKDSKIYMLSGSTLYAAASPTDEPEPVIHSVSGERCTVYGNGFLFWSAEKNAPLYYAEEGQTPTILYRPRERLNSVSVYKDTIAAVRAFSGLVLLDGKSGKQLFTYQAAGLQDAVQVDDTFVLITKSTGGIIRQPLLLIDIRTGETIPLNMEGDIAFSAQANNKVKNTFSCFRLKTEKTTQTDLMTMKIDTTHPARSSFTAALSYGDENLQASLYDDGYAVLTNLGKNQLSYYDKKRRVIRQLPRDYALSRKALMTDTYIVSVNYDGSLSWLNRRTMQLLQHKTLTEN
ncbi:hypothetical protein DWB79_09620 [Treponema medium]|uniref:WD40 repeat domain-containing protein n=2 Tax=Treponema medium TaxID=58231 RepID=A0AA87NLL6_TREMD|nr:WD40 repeat domain-containing protein [Treponema medium]EPF28206.1 hypothetical protein HMPREF9195_01898 [Treponema medium ATCC 700293]QSH98001.1 hypothetical protein DWB79_09620 [Treponema medium]